MFFVIDQNVFRYRMVRMMNPVTMTESSHMAWSVIPARVCEGPLNIM